MIPECCFLVRDFTEEKFFAGKDQASFPVAVMNAETRTPMSAREVPTIRTDDDAESVTASLLASMFRMVSASSYLPR